MVSQLTGTLSDIDLVNDNCGQSGCYLPAQPPLEANEISRYSTISDNGSSAFHYNLPLSTVRSLRYIEDETNPALIQAKPEISIIELN